MADLKKKSANLSPSSRTEPEGGKVASAQALRTGRQTTKTSASCAPATSAEAKEERLPFRPASRKGSKSTKDAILEAAQVVFAKSGYDGASTVGIAKQAKCYESLIYYHYGNKDKLFAAVLEDTYRKLVEAEKELKVDFSDPEKALADVVLFMWHYYQDHPELILVLNMENLLKGKHVKGSGALQKYLPRAIGVLRSVVESGIERGVLRPDVNVDDLYLSVMGLGYFYLSNRFTLSAFFGKELMAEAERERWGRWMVEMIFSSVKKT